MSPTEMEGKVKEVWRPEPQEAPTGQTANKELILIQLIFDEHI